MDDEELLFDGMHGDVRIAAAPEDCPPFPVDAVVAEEDTYLVLSAGSDIHYADQHPLRVINEAFAAEPARPGSVVIREGDPVRLLAVIHDLEKDPSWCEMWIAAALDSLLAHAHQHRYFAIATPLLGTVHGRLEPTRALALLTQALDRAAPIALKRVWVVIPHETDPDVFEDLDDDHPAARVLPFRRDQDD